MAQSTTKATPDDLGKQLDTLREDVAQLTRTIAQLTRDEAEHAADTARDALGKARAGVAQEYDRVSAQGRQAVDHADALIREKPAMAMGVAAGVGLLVGLMMSRKS